MRGFRTNLSLSNQAIMARTKRKIALARYKTYILNVCPTLAIEDYELAMIHWSSITDIVNLIEKIDNLVLRKVESALTKNIGLLPYYLPVN